MACDTWWGLIILSKNLAHKLLWFGSEGVLKIWRKRITERVNELINDEGVCGTTQAVKKTCPKTSEILSKNLLIKFNRLVATVFPKQI